jgi:hypothetical protein
MTHSKKSTEGGSALSVCTSSAELVTAVKRSCSTGTAICRNKSVEDEKKNVRNIAARRRRRRRRNCRQQLQHRGAGLSAQCRQLEAVDAEVSSKQARPPGTNAIKHSVSIADGSDKIS